MPLKSWTSIFAIITALLTAGAVIMGVCALLDVVSIRTFVVMTLAAFLAAGLSWASHAQDGRPPP